jgi:hypothetical protein
MPKKLLLAACIAGKVLHRQGWTSGRSNKLEHMKAVSVCFQAIAVDRASSIACERELATKGCFELRRCAQPGLGARTERLTSTP